uniref:Uncharacterized protein n=1 Tax=Oryza rufipogon TaxID=4529 RepID=A0A0E0R8K1_ORYRU
MRSDCRHRGCCLLLLLGSSLPRFRRRSIGKLAATLRDSEVVKGSTLRLDAAAETSDHARALQLLAAPIWLLLLIQSGCCCLPLGLPLLQLDARGLLLLFLANLLRSRRYAVGKPAMLADVVADEPQCNHPPMLPLEEEFPCRGAERPPAVEESSNAAPPRATQPGRCVQQGWESRSREPAHVVAACVVDLEVAVVRCRWRELVEEHEPPRVVGGVEVQPGGTGGCGSWMDG